MGMAAGVVWYTLCVRILSIDAPGTRRGGYVFEDSDGSLTFGEIEVDPTKPERQDYLQLYRLLQQYLPELLIIERPFLHIIAGKIGGLKMGAAVLGIPYWEINPSRAKVLVFGKGRGRADKKEVKHWAETTLNRKLSQHCADSYLYLRAYHLAT